MHDRDTPLCPGTYKSTPGAGACDVCPHGSSSEAAAPSLASCICGPHFRLDLATKTCVISDSDVYDQDTAAELTFRLVYAASRGFTPAAIDIGNVQSAAFAGFQASVLSNVSLAVSVARQRLVWLSATNDVNSTFVDVSLQISASQDASARAPDASPLLVAVVCKSLIQGNDSAWYTSGVLTYTSSSYVLVQAVLDDNEATPTISKVCTGLLSLAPSTAALAIVGNGHAE
jgi:hypothetical protein